MWEGVGDRTELQHIDPHSYGHQRLFPALQGCSAGGLGAHSAGYRLPLQHLVSNGSDLQTHWLPVFTELYNSSIAHSISLEWYVWSSSSGNNCHAVHRSLSSGASVYDCTMGFYLVPYCQPSPPTRFLPITTIGMCHFLPVHHFGMACLAGSKVNIQHIVPKNGFITKPVFCWWNRTFSQISIYSCALKVDVMTVIILVLINDIQPNIMNNLGKFTFFF